MRILVSACLLGSPCKYNGGDNLCPRLLELTQGHTLIPLCPEQLGGLSTPRPPAERKDGRVITQSGKDVTECYQKGAAEVARLARLLGVEAAILKARSPACGCGSIYDGTFTHTQVAKTALRQKRCWPSASRFTRRSMFRTFLQQRVPTCVTYCMPCSL